MYVYVAIGAVVVVLVSLITIVLYTYLSKKDDPSPQEETQEAPQDRVITQLKDDASAYVDILHTKGPANCTFADIVNNMGFLRSFDERNRKIVSELLNTVDVFIHSAVKKPEVDSVMRGMDRNFNLLLENVNYDNVLAMLFAIYLCNLAHMNHNNAYEPNLAECIDSKFVGGVDRFAEIAAKELNTFRDNVAAKSNQLVYGDVQGVNQNELLMARQNVDKTFREISATPPFTKDTVLQGIRSSQFAV